MVWKLLERRVSGGMIVVGLGGEVNRAAFASFTPRVYHPFTLRIMI